MPGAPHLPAAHQRRCRRRSWIVMSRTARLISDLSTAASIFIDRVLVVRIGVKCRQILSRRRRQVSASRWSADHRGKAQGPENPGQILLRESLLVFSRIALVGESRLLGELPPHCKTGRAKRSHSRPACLSMASRRSSISGRATPYMAWTSASDSSGCARRPSAIAARASSICSSPTAFIATKT